MIMFCPEMVWLPQIQLEILSTSCYPPNKMWVDNMSDGHVHSRLATVSNCPVWQDCCQNSSSPVAECIQCRHWWGAVAVNLVLLRSRFREGCRTESRFRVTLQCCKTSWWRGHWWGLGQQSLWLWHMEDCGLNPIFYEWPKWVPFNLGHYLSQTGTT